MQGGCGKGRDDGSTPCDDGYAMHNDGSAVPDNRSAVRDDGLTARDDGSASRDDEYESLKINGRRRVRNVRRQVQGRVTTGVSRATTVEIARQRVARRATTGPTPRRHVAAIVYKGGRLVRDSRSD